MNHQLSIEAHLQGCATILHIRKGKHSSMFGDTKETKFNKSEYRTEGDSHGSQHFRKGKQWDL